MTPLSRRTSVTLVLLALLVVLDAGAARAHRQLDLTAEHSQTLTAETRHIVGRLHHQVHVTAFFGRADAERISASTLLLRYRRLSNRISFRVLDPAAAPGEAQRLGVDPLFGGIALRMGSRVERSETATEQDVTAAIARLLRGKAGQVCMTAGHGERDPQSGLDDGFQRAAAVLGANGYHLRAVDLLVDPRLPAGCDAVLVADPTSPLGDAATASLRDYLGGGGRAVVLADPVSTVDLGPLLAPYGLGTQRGIVLETDPSAHLPDDPTRPVVSRYGSSSPIVRHLPPTFFPGAEAVTTARVDNPGLSVATLARTSPRSFLDTNPGPVAEFDPARDIRGPIALGAAADLSENLGNRVRRTRVVVFGDTDFASNAFVAQAGNAALLTRSLDWATLEEDLVTVSTNLAELRPLELTKARLAYARLLTAGAIPALFLLTGVIVWGVRRAR